MRDFLKTYDLEDGQNTKVDLGKYSTKAAEFYRKMLEAKANNESFNEMAPTYEEGRK